MRLIDEKELLNERPETLNPNMNDEIKSAYNKGWNACNSEWISLIDDQPTAYDIDEVVEQLEAWKEKQLAIADREIAESDSELRKGIIKELKAITEACIESSIEMLKGGLE